MKIKNILNNCIYMIFENNRFDNIFVYGSENLELEKLIFKLTSSPIIGGDVDFCNVLFGNYFSGNKNLNLKEEIYKDFALNNNFNISNIKKLALSIIYKTYKPKNNTEHNLRIYNNIISHKESLIKEITNQIKNINLQLRDFKECDIEDFIQLATDKDIIIIDNQNHNFINKKIIEILYNLKTAFVVFSKKQISNLYEFQIVKSKNLNIYSNMNIKSKLLLNQITKTIPQKSFNIIEDNAIIENIEIRQLTLEQFNALRQKYISKQIHFTGTPKVCYGLFTDNKLFGVFGLTNDYKNKVPKDVEQPCLYLLSDFIVNSSIKKLSKLVLFCVLSKEVKLLAERLINREVKSIFTNVFTKNMSSIKYRDLFILQNRHILKNGNYKLTYFSTIGRWNLKEGLKLWKQKL